MNLPDKVRNKLRDIPDKPGCYLMRDRRGRIVYVGKAASLRKRVRSYFRAASLARGDPKFRGLVNSVADLEFIALRNEAEAILTEGRLIKDYKPFFNVRFKDDKRFLLLRAEPERDPFPRMNLCRIRRDDGARHFGPYASSDAARATLDFVEKRMGLRKCAPRVPDSETHAHCINDVVRYCSAPCIGKVTREEYHRRLEEACAFLAGERLGYLKEVRAGMERASSSLDYERAAALRDTLRSLHKTVKERARVGSTPETRREEARTGVEELKAALRLPGAPAVIEAYDASNISGTHAVAGMVCFVNGRPQRNRYRRFRIRTVEGSNDPAMIAEVIRRRFLHVARGEEKAPDLVLIDGGVAQVRAARRDLEALGLARVPAAGLAKQYEHIFWQDGAPPLVLPESSAALKVLKQLRDEAHRFALLYHRAMRSKRIRESALDEAPGISDRKKEILLKRFGSVRRLAWAEEEEIAGVPGIGPVLARAILEKLRKGTTEDGRRKMEGLPIMTRECLPRP
ncbi:MAG: excinuclease ABC subunit UvrC [Verrucomicrobiota bacterium]|nr:excinuclease ABC subunit UvrC [Verrucomicrobiota bacterium]